MKTKIYTTALIAMITLFATNIFAADFLFEEEAYIDDIPFNTEEIFLNSLFEELAYIDDIPFNTVQVAEEASVKEVELTNFEFEEEAYIDDIPFTTSSVVAQINFEKSQQVVFNFNDEEYINDIPFDTEEVALASEKESNPLEFMLLGCVNLLF